MNTRILDYIKSLNPNIKGCICILIASATFPAMTALVKFMSSSLDTLQIAFFRCFFGLIFILLINPKYIKKNLITQKLPLHILRTVLGLSAMLLGFWSISLLPLANITSISFTRILFIIPLAIIILGERPSKTIIISSILGYLGVVFIIGFENDSLKIFAYLAAILASIFIALVKILIKSLSKTEKTITIQLWFGIISSLVLIIPIMINYQEIKLLNILFLILIAFLGVLSQMLTIWGLKLADATKIMPMDFARIFFAVIYGYLIFAEVPNANVFFGSSIILLSIILILKKQV